MDDSDSFRPPTWGPGDATTPIVLTPIEEPAASRRPRTPILLMVAATVSVAVAASTLFVMRDRPSADDQRAEATIESKNDSETSLSFGAAAAATNAAQALQYDVTMDVSGQVGTITVTVDRSSQRFAMAVEGPVFGDDYGATDAATAIEMVVDAAAQTVYFGGDLYADVLSVGTPWMSISLDVMSESAGQSPDEFVQALFWNPLDVATTFGDVELIEAGTVVIDGEELRHYEVAIDVAEMLREDPDALGGFGGADLTALEEIVYDVFVTDTDVIRRLAFDVATGGDTVRFAMDVEAFAESIDIPIPDSADVTDMNDLFAAFGD